MAIYWNSKIWNYIIFIKKLFSPRGYTATYIISCSWLKSGEKELSNQNQSEISNDVGLSRDSTVKSVQYSSQFGSQEPSWLARQPRLAISLQGFYYLVWAFYYSFTFYYYLLAATMINKYNLPGPHTAAVKIFL